jgi:S1-C subfamily serine protease
VQLIVDLVLAVAGILVAIRSARRGALAAAASIVGWVVGFWIGLLFAPGIVGAVDAFGALQPWQRNVLVLVVVLLIAAVCSVIVISVANVIRRAIRHVPVAGGLDAIAGAVLGALSWAVVVWLLAGFITSTGIRPLAQLAQSSRIVAALDSYAPVPQSAVFGAVDDAIAAAGLPKVFEQGEGNIAGAAPPPTTVPAAVRAASSSVVEVVADEPKCGTISSGTGWVVAANRIVTNAHVVAGASTTTVLADGKSRSLHATVVSYDPETDLAVLAVDGLGEKPIPLNGASLPGGAAAYAAGYPGGGPYTITPSRVRETVIAVGRDIYDQNTVKREIYALRAAIRAGDSGGPLLDAQGRVSGVVFARSTTDGQTGYALTMKQVEPTLMSASSLTREVSTGACTAG